METKIFTDELAGAAELIQRGEMVAVPTETVYGLAANGLNAVAVQQIYEVKGRPAVKPLSLMVHDASSMERYCSEVPESAKRLAAKFWPGPLTIVMKAKPFIPPIVLAGGSTVGLRCPDHPLTLKLLELSGLPFAAPSANPSGLPSPKTAEAVREYFDGKIGGIVDGGECGIGKESTLIDVSQTPYRILRQGALPAEEIADELVNGLKTIGITGGTGCGKTTALETLKSFGALIIDCDSVYHELLDGSRELLGEIESEFPGVVQDGALNRKALGVLVFNNAAALEKLNKISHRYITQELRRRLRDFAMSGGRLAAIDAIELFSSGLDARCSATVGIIAESESRIQRIMARDSISRQYAEMRVNAQHTNEYFKEKCGYIIENSGNIEDFRLECRKIFMEAINNG